MQKVDSIVRAIVQRFISRAEFGAKKYGTDLDRKDLSVGEWLQHLQDELHDAYLYSEKLKEEQRKESLLLHLALLKVEGVNLTAEMEATFQELYTEYRTNEN